MQPLNTMAKGLTRHFRDPRLQQLFGRYATYCGSSPYLAPATLMLIAHVEQDGVWYLKNGMYSLIEALVTLADDRGCELQFNSHVDKILTKELKHEIIKYNDVFTLSRVFPSRRSLLSHRSRHRHLARPSQAFFVTGVPHVQIRARQEVR